MKRQWTSIGRGISILLVGLTLGLLLSVSRGPQAESAPKATMQEEGKIWQSISRLEAEQAELKARLAELRQDVNNRQQEAAANTDRFRALNDELARQQLLAGLVPVQGPGVMLILDDSSVQVPLGADPNSYIIHEYDLRDIVNVLWMAGSEGIAINDERLVNQSSIYCAGSTVMVNTTRLSPPYVIQAVGNPRVQQDYLRNPSYLKGLKDKQRLYGLALEVQGVSEVSLPAYSGGFLVQYARLGE